MRRDPVSACSLNQTPRRGGALEPAGALSTETDQAGSSSTASPPVMLTVRWRAATRRGSAKELTSPSPPEIHESDQGQGPGGSYRFRSGSAVWTFVAFLPFSEASEPASQLASCCFAR